MLLSISDAARRLGVHPKTIRQRAKSWGVLQSDDQLGVDADHLGLLRKSAPSHRKSDPSPEEIRERCFQVHQSRAKENPTSIEIGEFERRILASLSEGPLSLDQTACDCSMDVQECRIRLAYLAAAGHVVKLGATFCIPSHVPPVEPTRAILDRFRRHAIEHVRRRRPARLAAAAVLLITSLGG
ncbi:MAG: hypothetical protein AAFV88_18315 [Planctomycetota bacterium]